MIGWFWHRVDLLYSAFSVLSFPIFNFVNAEVKALRLEILIPHYGNRPTIEQQQCKSNQVDYFSIAPMESSQYRGNFNVFT